MQVTLHRLHPRAGFFGGRRGRVQGYLVTFFQRWRLSLGGQQERCEFLRQFWLVMARSGFDAICLDRSEGPYPICTFTGDIGGRAALSVATISDRLGPSRLPMVVELLKREAAAIGPQINPFDPTLRRPSQTFGA